MEKVFTDRYGYKIRLQLEYVVNRYTKKKLCFKKWLEKEEFKFIQDATREFFDEHYKACWKAIDSIADKVFYLKYRIFVVV